MEQEMQQMFGVSVVGILGLGFVIVILLVILGLLEKNDYSKRVKMIRTGGILLGIMIIATGLIWYGILVATPSTSLTLGDVVLLTLDSSIGGLISGISCCIPIKQ